MDECTLVTLGAIVNYATCAYWFLFLCTWLCLLVWQKKYCLPLHTAIAVVVLVKILSKLMSVPVYLACHSESWSTIASEIGITISWASTFVTGILICRGYGVTYWEIGRKPLCQIACGCFGLLVFELVSIIVPVEGMFLFPLCYFMALYTVQMYYGLRTLWTLSAIEKYVYQRSIADQYKPLKAIQLIMRLIFLSLTLFYMFMCLVLVLSVLNIFIPSIGSLYQTLDVSIMLMDPVLNTLIYYLVRPRTNGQDMISVVDSSRPFSLATIAHASSLLPVTKIGSNRYL